MFRFMIQCIAAMMVIFLAIGAVAFGQATKPTAKLIPVIDRPTTEADMRPGLSVQQIRLTGDGKTVVVHAHAKFDSSQGFLLASFDLASGKPKEVFEITANAYTLWVAFDLTSNGQHTCFFSQEGNLVDYDIKTNKLAWEWKSKPDQQVDTILRFSTDGRFAAGTINHSTVMLWNLANGNATTTKLEFLPAGDGAIAIPLDERRIALFTKNNGSPDDDARKYNLDLFDLTTAKKQHLTEVFSGLSCWPLPEKKQALVLRGNKVSRPLNDDGTVRSQDLYWTAIELWDLEKLQKLTEIKLDAPLHAEMMKVSLGGHFLLMHAPGQRVHIWNIPAQEFVAQIGPEQGCDAFDISRDEKTLAVVYHEKDANAQSKLVTYDLTPLLSPAPVAK